MAQIFGPATNTIATASLFGGAALPFLLMFTGSGITNSPANTGVTVPLDQPAPFSHKHHAYELGIDCRFCHLSVEDSPNAGVPSTDVCMTCHSQIWTNSPNLEAVRKSYETGTAIQWNKVNAVPDFVYFNHSIHINRGVSCNNCHGAVNDMPITWKGQAFRMAWCLECHQEPQKYLYADATLAEGASPREQVFQLYRKLAAGDQLTDIERNLAKGLPQVVPADKVHEGVRLMKDRGINMTQLRDCYVCHH
ncbi:MAG: cytochrome c3 family protein [Fimbriimonadaceae bacterium]|nr:cytochrome c3 family protein [Fimbriimonadaceae bacterium]QYK56418.1 MAG: cytochrome c3 family protein [Fimbriimonadaceae bacterium]